MPDQNQNTPPPETPPKDPPPAKVAIQVGEETKEFGAEEVSALLSKVSNADGFLKTCDKYEINPDDYLAQSEGAFAVVRQLLEKGVINEQGEVVTKEAPAGDPSPVLPGLPPGGPTEDKKLAPVIAALDDINKRLGGIEKDQDSLLRLDLEREVKEKHPGMDSDDVSRALALASRDRRKGLWDHVADIASGKTTKESEARLRYAKEFGVDLETFDKNKLNEGGPEGGGSALFGGKKFSFRKKGGDFVSPKEATMEFFKKIHVGGT